VTDPAARVGLLQARLALLPTQREGEDPRLTRARAELQDRIAALKAEAPPSDRLPYRDE
jgi:hypothetical protein